MLAVRLEADIAKHDHLVVTVDFVERPPQEFDGIVAVAALPIFVRARDSLGRMLEAFTVGIVADPKQQRTYGSLGFFAGGALHGSAV